MTGNRNKFAASLASCDENAYIVMAPFRLLPILAMLLSFPQELAGQIKDYEDKPACELGTEIQFYTAEFDILGLPEECYEKKHLTTIGFIIQDVIYNVEERLPLWKEEKSETDVCPFPKELQENQRSLQNRKNRKRNPRSYKYTASGACRRCRKRNNDRLRMLRTSQYFGIEDFVLVDVIGNRDINGALDCDPVNKCFGSAKKFNVRAKVFGNRVHSVYLAIDGPNGKKSSRTDRVWGDRVVRYKQLEFVPGTYTVMAQATNYRGEKSPVFSKTFTVEADSRPTNVSAVSSNAIYSGRMSESEYLNRLSANLATSNTACEKVKQAVIQKTIAEETVVQGNQAYDEVLKLALRFDGNVDVEEIKTEAELAHLRVLDEAAKASSAADLASKLCSKPQMRSLRRLVEEDEVRVQEEVEIAATAVVESRLALSQEKALRDEMEELVALIEFDPVFSELEADIDEDVVILLEHKMAVLTEILHVDLQIQALLDGAPEVIALEKKRDCLVAEERQIEKALSNRGQFRFSQSALKKDEFYESVAPDFDKSPALQYNFRSRQSGNDFSMEFSWISQKETAGSKEEWFRRFGEMAVVDVLRRLRLAYNTTNGGCIAEENIDLSVVVIVAEAVSVWETLDLEECTANSL